MKNTIRNTSWVDLLIEWIDRLPLPVWLFYLLLFAFLSLTTNLAFGGDPDVGLFDNFYGAFYTTFTLGLIHVLHRMAASSFDQFTPSLPSDERQLEKSRRRFMLAPAWIGWVATVMGIYSFIDTARQEISNASGEVSIFTIVGAMPTLILSSIFTIYFLLNTIRRLRLIIQLHAQVEVFDLFDQESLRSFSRYSSITAFALLILILSNSPWIIESIDQLEELLFYIFISLLALVVFIVPLIGLRNRIMAERDKKVNGIMADMDLTANKISEAVRADDLDRIDKLKVGLDGLIIQRDEIRSLKTWPWSAATLRGIGSAFLLPLLIWLVTRLLERYI